jgi:hypothetical protein
MLPGLVRFGGAFRRARPDRVSGSATESSAWDSDAGGASVAASSTGTCSVSFSLPLAFPRGFRCDLGFAGLCFGVTSGRKSSIDSGSGRCGLAVTGDPAKLDFLHKVLADEGVPRALCGERLTGVEKEYRACVIR